MIGEGARVLGAEEKLEAVEAVRAWGRGRVGDAELQTIWTKWFAPMMRFLDHAFFHHAHQHLRSQNIMGFNVCEWEAKLRCKSTRNNFPVWRNKWADTKQGELTSGPML